MIPSMRYGNKWNINELLALQREYELLEWSIQEIAEKHRRSVDAILFRLESEGYISAWHEARGFELLNYNNEKEEEDDDEEELKVNSLQDKCENDIDDNISKLSERVWSLETSVSEIGSMVKQMFEQMVTNNTAKREPLRKY